jgi:hypothetical protein
VNGEVVQGVLLQENLKEEKKRERDIYLSNFTLEVEYSSEHFSSKIIIKRVSHAAQY